MSQERPKVSEDYIDYSDCLISLGSNPEGLTNLEVDERRKEFGANTLTLEKGISPILMFLRQFKSPLVYILILRLVFKLLKK